ncbi:MAG: hypothetical protein QXH08_03455 [Candidatus Hadarchaeales archaeon]
MRTRRKKMKRGLTLLGEEGGAVLVELSICLLVFLLLLFFLCDLVSYLLIRYKTNQEIGKAVRHASVMVSPSSTEDEVKATVSDEVRKRLEEDGWLSKLKELEVEAKVLGFVGGRLKERVYQVTVSYSLDPFVVLVLPGRINYSYTFRAEPKGAI